jgi:hypothetical protein
MAMGKRKRDREPMMWVATTDLPTTASHPFYARLNQLLHERGFDDFAEAQCAEFLCRHDGPTEPGTGRLFPAAADRLFRRPGFGTWNRVACGRLVRVA